MLLAEYGGGGDLPRAIRNIVWHLPLCQAWCLYATTAARYGNDPKGPTFVETDMVFAIRATRPPKE